MNAMKDEQWNTEQRKSQEALGLQESPHRMVSNPNRNDENLNCNEKEAAVGDDAAPTAKATTATSQNGQQKRHLRELKSLRIGSLKQRKAEMEAILVISKANSNSHLDSSMKRSRLSEPECFPNREIGVVDSKGSNVHPISDSWIQREKSAIPSSNPNDNSSEFLSEKIRISHLSRARRGKNQSPSPNEEIASTRSKDDDDGDSFMAQKMQMATKKPRRPRWTSNRGLNRKTLMDMEQLYTDTSEARLYGKNSASASRLLEYNARPSLLDRPGAYNSDGQLSTKGVLTPLRENERMPVFANFLQEEEATIERSPSVPIVGSSEMEASRRVMNETSFRSESADMSGNNARLAEDNRAIQFLLPFKVDSNRSHWCILCFVLVLVGVGGGICVVLIVTGPKEPTPSTQAPSSTPDLHVGDQLDLFNPEKLQRICPQGAETFDASILPDDVVEAYLGLAKTLEIDDPIDSCTPNTLALLFVSASEVQEAVSTASMYLLCVIYFSTGGPNAWNERGGWLESSEFCEWKGVNCLGSHILALNLANSGLTGTIPTTLRHFSDLEELRLDGNEFTGSVPSELGELPNLIILDLARNQVSGTLPPELSGNTNLRRLDFSLNRIAGTIPSEWVKMTSLMFLNGGSNFIESSIPTFLGDLRFLENIELQSNSISGSIPMELLNLTKLLEMDLSNNQITGTLPSEIDQFTQIEKFRSAFNRHTGTIPSQIGRLSGLAELAVQGNELTGTIPSELGLCTHMHTLTFHRNKLEGTIPGEFVNLSQLEKLITFGNNALTGTISPEMCSLNHLATLVAVCDENDKVVCGCCTKKFCISN